MSFNFRVGAEAQPYAAAPARNTAVEEPQNETTRLTIAKSGDGDTVSISEQGKEKLAAMKSDSSETKKSSELPIVSMSRSKRLKSRSKNSKRNRRTAERTRKKQRPDCRKTK